MIIFALEYLGGKLMDKGLDKFKDKSEIKKVYDSINQFNFSFEDTDLDTNAFQNFLNEIDIQEEWFSQVFQYKHKSSENKESFIEEMVRKAVTYINNIYIESGRAEISADQLLLAYFEQLYSHLEKKREELFTLSETAQLTVIGEMLWEMKEEINNKIDVLIRERKVSVEINRDFEELLKYLKIAYKKLKSMENPSKTIREINKEISDVFEKEHANIINYLNQGKNPEQTIYRYFYDACLNYGINENRKYHDIHLGVSGELFVRFKQIISMLREIQESISKDTKENYLRLIQGAIDEDTRKLLIYSMIYFDEHTLIECFDEIDAIDYYGFFGPPLDITRGRSFWGYVVKNKGKLDPYPLSNILNPKE